MILGVRAVGGVFHTPSLQAVIPLLVPRDHLVRVGDWGQFMQSGAFMLGPVLGAALYGSFSLPIIMLTDVIGALTASLCVAVIVIPDHKRSTRAIANV